MALWPPIEQLGTIEYAQIIILSVSVVSSFFPYFPQYTRIPTTVSQILFFFFFFSFWRKHGVLNNKNNMYTGKAAEPKCIVVSVSYMLQFLPISQTTLHSGSRVWQLARTIQCTSAKWDMRSFMNKYAKWFLKIYRICNCCCCGFLLCLHKLNDSEEIYPAHIHFICNGYSKYSLIYCISLFTR